MSARLEAPAPAEAPPLHALTFAAPAPCGRAVCQRCGRLVNAVQFVSERCPGPPSGAP